jgi:hypothetical protein
MPLRIASYAGLTRVSIHLHKSLSKKMDGRIKSGHDGSTYQTRGVAFLAQS